VLPDTGGLEATAQLADIEAAVQMSGFRTHFGPQSVAGGPVFDRARGVGPENPEMAVGLVSQ
jgi:hypothetical protein